MRTRVKICGLTREQDVHVAVQAGADAIGLVFYQPSPRYIEPEQARQLVSKVPPFVTVVGLFVDASQAEVEAVLSEVKLDLLQFHGNETGLFCELFSRPYIKALRVADDTDITAYAEQYRSARGLLLDTYQAGVPGGTGEVFNWALIPQDLPMPIILAGGLHSGNVAQAIEQVQPYAVDVSGGLEQDKGIKDSNKIHAFMHEVHGVGRS